MAARPPKTPTIENRKARHDYVIEETLECGIVLRGTEVKSIRDGKASIGEGYVRAQDEPPVMELHGMHVAEYAPANAAHQHEPTRPRRLLAHRREIRKLAARVAQKGYTLVPLKMYFKDGRVKVLVGLGTGRRRADKRQVLSKKEAQREIDRAMRARR